MVNQPIQARVTLDPGTPRPEEQVSVWTRKPSVVDKGKICDVCLCADSVSSVSDQAVAAVQQRYGMVQA